MSETTTPELLVEQRGAVLWLTIQREERRNAMSHGVLAGMAQAIDAAQADRALRAIVVTGAGDKAFCAGADLQAAQAFTTDYSEPYGPLALLLRRAKASNLPLVARVNGACMAGGMGLLAMCDLAVSASHAVFGLPEVKVGVFPAQVLSVLQHLMPRRKLAEMCLTGEPLDCRRRRWSMAWSTTSTTTSTRKLDWLLQRLLDKSPAAIRRGLYTMKKIEIDGLRGVDGVHREPDRAVHADRGCEGRPGRPSSEKRKPQWKGR